jgi:hypothetical protein
VCCWADVEPVKHHKKDCCRGYTEMEYDD